MGLEDNMQFFTSGYNRFELDEKRFFEAFPKRPEDAHKGSSGRILLVSGSFGMAGAASLNILGAKALGAQYIIAAVPEDIYPVVAAANITAVYLPYAAGYGRSCIMNAPSSIRTAALGSGSDNNPELEDILMLMLYGRYPLVLDASALKLLKDKKDIASKRQYPLILTPHPGEFALICPDLASLAGSDPVKAAAECSADFGAVTVLKGPNTVVASPDGRVYINETGNQGLAQAGSGDVLTGMITAMLSLADDPFEASCMGVFAHGLAADRLCMKHARQTMPLEDIPKAMDELFFEHGF